MDISILEELGLSKGEAKLYLTLLQIGESKVGGIIGKSNMASSAVHNSVNSLINKGIVSYIKKGKIKFYQAVPPKQLIEFIEGKKKRFLEVLPELEAKQNLSKDKQEAEIFKGIKGITSMLNILIENTKKGDEYFFFTIDVDEKNKEVQEFFETYDIKRKSKGLITKGLAQKELKKLFEKRKFVEMKYPDFPIPSNISICGNRMAFFSWGEKPVGCLIESDQLVKKYKELFIETWKMTKK
ncbi:hypothetical protein J4474_01615 [Candidatus Pacearchaeota archaeon]|nr:hypothetical protein [Candidatus Pacearchaeota archaeon]